MPVAKADLNVVQMRVALPAKCCECDEHGFLPTKMRGPEGVWLAKFMLLTTNPWGVLPKVKELCALT